MPTKHNSAHPCQSCPQKWPIFLAACFDGPRFWGWASNQLVVTRIGCWPRFKSVQASARVKWAPPWRGKKEIARCRYGAACTREIHFRMLELQFCYWVLAMWAESQATAVPALIDTFSLQSAPAGRTRTICYFPHQQALPAHSAQSAGSAVSMCKPPRQHQHRHLPKSKRDPSRLGWNLG